MRYARSLARLLATLTGCSAALTLAPMAHANHTSGGSGTISWAKWIHMPDFDQRRSALPNNGGMYCVPTSTTNIFAYLSRHGYPMAYPGSRSVWEWQSNAQYDEVTSNLSLLGAVMGTHGVDGTDGNGYFNGLDVLVSNQPFTYYAYWTNDDYTPNFESVELFTFAKYPTSINVGWFTQEGSVVTRVGGHDVSVQKVWRDTSGAGLDGLEKISIRDPADDNDDLTTQSTFVSQEYDIAEEYVIYQGKFRWMDKLVGYGSGRLDGLTAFKPLQGLTTDSDGLSIWLHLPNKFGWDSSASLRTFDLNEIGHKASDIEEIPGSLEIAYIKPHIGRDDVSSIWKLNPITGVHEHIIDAPFAQEIEFGRFRQLYVRMPDKLQCINIDNPDGAIVEAT
ncbi:MAG: hypothetical protein ACYTF7_10805, partial [Planctomycetota bacterium]